MMTETESTETAPVERMVSELMFRSCLKEEAVPLKGEITGQIPEWLEGELIRNGGGLYEIGDYKYNHLFDGLALMHRFQIGNGAVTYSNKFLRSNRYNVNTEANRIVLGEFGTASYPDPCKTIWQRFMSRFSGKPAMGSDNCNITASPYGDEIYVATEGNTLWRVNIETLETLDKVDLSDYVSVQHATAHVHIEKDGTVYNVGNSYSKGAYYNIIKFPPPKKEKDETISSFKQASILATIPSRWSLHPGYYHSFAITENYIIFIEQPLCISLPRAAFATIRNTPLTHSLVWYDKYKTRFYVVNKATGVVSPLQWESSERFFFFHTINAYEDNDHLVVDVCAFNDAAVINAVYREQLEKSKISDKTRWNLGGLARRFILPLSPKKGVAHGTNLVSLPDTKCTAVWGKSNQIVCVSDDIPEIVFELPRINYDLNGKKYRYFYAICRDGLVKVDWETRQNIMWREEGSYATEPVFIEDPNGTQEDDGVILSSLMNVACPNQVDLVILDARSFTEIGRANFKTASAVPFTFHGTFFPPSAQNTTNDDTVAEPVSDDTAHPKEETTPDVAEITTAPTDAFKHEEEEDKKADPPTE